MIKSYDNTQTQISSQRRNECLNTFQSVNVNSRTQNTMSLNTSQRSKGIFADRPSQFYGLKTYGTATPDDDDEMVLHRDQICFSPQLHTLNTNPLLKNPLIHKILHSDKGEYEPSVIPGSIREKKNEIKKGVIDTQRKLQ